MPKPIAPQYQLTPGAKVPYHICPRCNTNAIGESTICVNCGHDTLGLWPAYDKMCAPGSTISLTLREYHRARICVAACDGVPADVMVVPGFVARNDSAHVGTIVDQQIELAALRRALTQARLHITGEALPTKAEALALIDAALAK